MIIDKEHNLVKEHGLDIVELAKYLKSMNADTVFISHTKKVDVDGRYKIFIYPTTLHGFYIWSPENVDAALVEFRRCISPKPYMLNTLDMLEHVSTKYSDYAPLNIMLQQALWAVSRLIEGYNVLLVVPYRESIPVDTMFLSMKLSSLVRRVWESTERVDGRESDCEIVFEDDLSGKYLVASVKYK